MVIVLGVVAVVAVIVIALVAVGREASTLATQPAQSHYDLEEAVTWVGDRLPEEVAARITYDDVRSILRWHLEYLRDRGVPVRRDLTKGGPVVVEDDEGVAFVLLKADEAGLDVTDTEVATVLETELRYLEAIGAIGGEVADPLALTEGDAGPAGELPGAPGPA